MWLGCQTGLDGLAKFVSAGALGAVTGRYRGVPLRRLRTAMAELPGWLVEAANNKGWVPIGRALRVGETLVPPLWMQKSLDFPWVHWFAPPKHYVSEERRYPDRSVGRFARIHLTDLHYLNQQTARELAWQRCNDTGTEGRIGKGMTQLEVANSARFNFIWRTLPGQ